MCGDEIEAILEINPLTGEMIADYERVTIYPAKHFVISSEKVDRAVRSIRQELVERLAVLEQAGLRRIIHVIGPYSDWDRLHLAATIPG